jgi:hypothetical protein
MPKAPVVDPKGFSYDVAISFLWRDEPFARRLKAVLEPGLRVYVASEEAERALGTDGMVHFANVFRHESRLSVVLYRDGWGDTDFTAVEEQGIQARALKTHFQSFMLVRLEQAELREWIPPQHLYVDPDHYSFEQIIAVIRARAAEVGAEVRRESAAQAALRQQKETNAKVARADRLRSTAAIRQIDAELTELFRAIESEVLEVAQNSPSELNVTVRIAGRTCVISGPLSASLRFRPQYSNHIVGAILDVVEWRGFAHMPYGDGNVMGGAFLGRTCYEVAIGDDDEWIWNERPDLNEPRSSLFRTSERHFTRRQMIDTVVGDYFARLFAPPE